MPLTLGATLGSYEISAKIGEGGMGEVYRARDTKLDRDVALKVLPEAFTSDPERLARFEREAKVLASLSHPNIAGIYGLEEAAPSTAGGASSGEVVRALVLELVEGPTLADLLESVRSGRSLDRPSGGSEDPRLRTIKSAPGLPIEETLPIAKQIAEALEAAHEAGVIHRDLKPANIKVRDDGTVKVLDFGLAKAFEPATADVNLSRSTTLSLTTAGTQMGVILGTPAYMAPEQAKGKPVDKRADVWAFGAVLYEMVTGRKLYEAGDVSEVLASVVLKDPDISAIGGQVPAHIRALLRRCLVKDPKNRLRDIGEVRIALTDPGSGVAPGRTSETATRLPVWLRPVPALIAVGLIVVISAAVGALLVRPTDEPADVVRVSMALSESAPLVVTPFGTDLAISPDGREIVYVGPAADGGFGTMLYRRAIDELEAVPLAGTDRGQSPFFSADGEWIAFSTPPGVRLLRVPTGGGVPEVVESSTETGRAGGTWTADDRIIVGQIEGGLLELSTDGADPTSLTTPDAERGESGHGFPAIVPEREAVLFAITDPSATTSLLAVLDLDTGEVTRLGLAGRAPRYVGTGHVVYVDPDGALWAVGFDLERLALQGRPVQLLRGVTTKRIGSANFGVSRAGRLVYAGGPEVDLSLVWVDRTGETLSRIGDVSVRGAPRVSPDGSRLALVTAEDDVWILDLEREGATRLTVEGTNVVPAWAPDGSSVTFASIRGSGTIDLYSKPADFSGRAELLLAAPETLIPGSWSSDGEVLVYHQTTAAINRDLWSLPVSGDPVSLRATEFDELAPRLSPDGLWVAFVSNQTGGERVYMQPFSGGRVVSVSTGPGTEPVWARDGRELFYRDGDRMMVVDVTPGPDATVSTPRVLFEGAYAPDPYRIGVPNYDVAADGQRFVMVKGEGTAPDAAAQGIVLVENWFEELRQMVPVP